MSPSLRLLLLNVVCVLLFPIPTLQTVVVSPISKDKFTNLFTLSVFLKTPLRRTELYLDLGYLFPWTVCDANYNSSSFRQIPCDDTFCLDLGFGGLSCTNCDIVSPRDPNCVPGNKVCGTNPENPITRAYSADSVLVDTLALPTTEARGPLFLLPNYTFSCAEHALLKGLPKHIKGLASLGRSKLSLQAQISAALSIPRVVALCFPASPKAPGVAIFGSTGPYHAIDPSPPPSRVDVSFYLSYTPLIVNPYGYGDTVISYPSDPPGPNSNQYFIELTSIQINDHPVPIDASLLTIRQDNGFGGTKISTATPYTVLESSIYKAFTELFVKEASSSPFNLTVTTPVKPFSVCYPAKDLTLTSVGPVVPTIYLVLHAPNVLWRILGTNSMVKVTDKKKGVDLWCLGFIDGGSNVKTPIAIGGKQLEDNLLQIDLESKRLGYTTSLLPITCPDLIVAHRKQ